ncbi:MAG: hypothetical protein HOH04_05515 [Rhodospirillaceae bacterium]|jgi:hypothetical protein|nr:hypothetical protein [Rhodospirillaceae bacterium]
MCTVVTLRRPGHAWPLLIAANRDEMIERAWSSPARHWAERAHVVAGRDEEAGGTWLALNDDGVAAAILNRYGSLGPAPDKRSRGELPLEAVDHAEAHVAAEALAQLQPSSYKTFNLVIADAREAFWLRSDGSRIDMAPIPEGLSMITSSDLNDTAGSARIRFHKPLFEAAAPPDPDVRGAGDWSAWEACLASTDGVPGGDHGRAINIETDFGFGTVSSSLIALPDPTRFGAQAQWRFCAGRPGSQPFAPVTLV